MNSIRTRVSAAVGRGSLLRWAAALWLGTAMVPALAQTPPAAATTTYAYDEAGNKTSQTDALHRTTRWTYDALDRVTSRLLPDGTRETSSYDAVGNLVGRTTFAGEGLSFQYDSQDRLTGQAIPAGTGTNQGIPAGSALFRYTPTGMLASRSEQGPTTLAGEQTFRYDAMDRLVEVKGPTGQINYGRDAAGNVIQRSVAGAGTAHYEYDDAGRMTRVIAPDGKQTNYGYDAAGRLERVERQLNPHEGQAQVLITSYGYDSADRIVTIGHLRQRGSALSLVAGQRLTRAPNGTITRIETDRGDGSSGTGGQATGRVDAVQDFEFDALGRLTRENRTTVANGNVDTRYEYDVVGNRIKKTVTTVAGAEVTTYTYDVADRLTLEATSLPAGGSRSVSYTWDANGNLASKTEPGKVTLYRFDPLNRLIDIRQGATAQQAEAANPHVRYGYDAEGNRVRMWSGNEERTFLVDQEHTFAQLVMEVRNGERIEYLRGDGLIRQLRNIAGQQEELFPLQGLLDTSLGAIRSDGNVAESVAVDAFGQADDSRELRQTHLYTGEYWDGASELLNLRARWYDPKTGRFLSADPFEGDPHEPRTLNRYSYGHGDPIHWSDPSGLVALLTNSVSGVSQQMTYHSAKAQNAAHKVVSIRNQICKGMSSVGAALPRHHVLPKNVGGRRDFKSDVVEPLDSRIHEQIHSLMSLAFVMNDLPPTSNTSREEFKKIFRDPSTGTRDRIRARRIVLDVAKYVDTACLGVTGYVALTPKIKQILRSRAFDF